MQQETKQSLLEKQLQQLETEFSFFQSQMQIAKMCELRHKRKQLQEKIRNCKWECGYHQPQQGQG